LSQSVPPSLAQFLNRRLLAAQVKLTRIVVRSSEQQNLFESCRIATPILRKTDMC